MMIKAVFMDLDNTLLRSDKSVSAYTIAMLNRCRERGIKLAFATARPRRAIDLVSPTGGIDGTLASIPRDGLIYHGGVAVEANGTLIARNGIETAAAKALIDTLLARWPSAALFLEVAEVLYCNFDAGRIWHGIDYIETDFSAMPHGPIDKLLVGLPENGTVGLPAGMAEALPGLMPEGLTVTPERGGIAIVTNAAATKRTGVVSLMNHWSIPLLYAAAFGDDMSDVSMLESVGWGIAVDNALPQVKAIADRVCAGNDADGVARWLEQNAL